MVDVRAKGKRGEYAVRDMLTKYTGVKHERVPGSGGFGASHNLKGDIYIPPSEGRVCTFTIECKHYKDEVFNSNLFGSAEGTFGRFWKQTLRESEQMKAKPMLVFKKDRGKWIAVLRQQDFAEMAHLVKSPVFTLTNKFDDVLVFVLFEDLVSKAPTYFYR